MWLPIVLFLLYWSPGQQVSPPWLYAGLVPAVAGGWPSPSTGTCRRSRRC
ncbi:hypothetical protein [Pseudonocardia sp. ICBG601]|nr:hypothetical protein [Pseudonocardia sp. ICBG601]